MYVPRIIFSAFKKAVSHFPAVLLTGPRQSGKTTFLLNQGARKASYVTFDDPLLREFAVTDPKGFLTQFKDQSAILDEIQYVPDIFPYLKMHMDTDRNRAGKWILTGSQQFPLMQNISESLAGRIVLLDLMPFDYREIFSFSPDASLEDMIWNSAYPEPAITTEKRDLWLRSYIQTYIERDVRQLMSIRDLNLFTFFLSVAASRHGQEFKKSIFSREVGISQPTIKKWVGILEASYLVYLLSPYYKNFGKRLIKSPKLYFLDSALVTYLTKQPDKKAALAGAMGGPLFEGWIISETVKAFYNMGKRPEIYFWRSHDGLEVDMIITIRGKLYPVEIKLTATPRVQHMRPIRKFIKLAGKEKCGCGVLACRTREIANMPEGDIALPWHEYPKWLHRELGSPE